MNEVEILRQELDAIPDPDDESVAMACAPWSSGRSAPPQTPKRRPPPEWLRITAAAGVALAALVAGALFIDFHRPPREDRHRDRRRALTVP